MARIAEKEQELTTYLYLVHMKKQQADEEALVAWNQIPDRIEASIRGMTDNDLDRSGGSEAWTMREVVHHLVEANLVASNMIIAALAKSACNFDWTWVNPDKNWMRRLGYHEANVEPAIDLLRALCRHISGLVAANPDALSRTVSLNDTPEGERYLMTVEQLLCQEAEHAAEHLAAMRSIR